MNKKLLALLLISQLSFSEEEKPIRGFKLPELEPVKPMPSFDSYESQCELENKQNKLPFKISYQTDYPTVQRRILQEGWAVLVYDVKEGKIANIKILDSSQENTFGASAEFSLKRAKLSEVSSDTQGCLARFIYKLAN